MTIETPEGRDALIALAMARRDIETADREIARLCEQIRALEKRIKAQEQIRFEASRKLDAAQEQQP